MKNDPTALQGSLLLADPSLRASWFGRSVILITHHAASEGTRGLVMNRPAEGRTLENLLPSPDFKELRKVPVYEGGPVSPGELMLVALRWNHTTGQLDCRSPLGIAGAIRARSQGWDIRAFTGYTGWSAGQLKDELAQSSWIIAPPQLLALEGTAAGLWSRLLRNMEDPRYALLADLPDDPGLN